MTTGAESCLGRVLRGSLVLFFTRILIATVIAMLITASMSARIASFGSDASFFDKGGLRAIELLDASRGSFGAFLREGSAMLVALAVIGLAPLGVVIARLGGSESTDARGVFRAATRPFPGLVLLLGVVSLLEAILFLVSYLGVRHFKDGTGVPNPLTIALELLLFVPPFALGALHDVARCALVIRKTGFYDACTCALKVARARPFALAAHYVSRVILALAVAALGTVITLAVGMRSTTALVIVVLVELSTFFGVAALRVSWLASIVSIEEALSLQDRLSEDRASLDDDVADREAPELSSARSETRSPGSSVGRAED